MIKCFMQFSQAGKLHIMFIINSRSRDRFDVNAQCNTKLHETRHDNDNNVSRNPSGNTIILSNISLLKRWIKGNCVGMFTRSSSMKAYISIEDSGKDT